MILIISSIFVFNINRTDTQKKEVVIKVQGRVVKDIPINDFENDKIYKFNFSKNTGYIEVKNGSVRMLEMDKKICPKKICSDTGWINKGYQEIVCLPNKITVSIKPSEKESIDGVAN